MRKQYAAGVMKRGRKQLQSLWLPIVQRPAAPWYLCREDPNVVERVLVIEREERWVR